MATTIQNRSYFLVGGRISYQSPTNNTIENYKISSEIDRVRYNRYTYFLDQSNHQYDTNMLTNRRPGIKFSIGGK